MFRTPGMTVNSISSGPLLQPLGSDVEVVIQLAPGSLPAYIGPNFAVDENSGFALVEGTTLQFRLRPDDELWAIGTDPTTSSKIQMIVQSVGQPS